VKIGTLLVEMGKMLITNREKALLSRACTFLSFYFDTEQSSPPSLQQNKVTIIIIFMVTENNPIGN
jgi:hypothetical protein